MAPTDIGPAGIRRAGAALTELARANTEVQKTKDEIREQVIVELRQTVPPAERSASNVSLRNYGLIRDPEPATVRHLHAVHETQPTARSHPGPRQSR